MPVRVAGRAGNEPVRGFGGKNVKMLIVSEVRILGWFLGIFNNFFAGWKPAVRDFCRLEARGPDFCFAGWKPAVQVQGLNFFGGLCIFCIFAVKTKQYWR